MSTRSIKISEHVLDRAKLFAPALAVRLKVTKLETVQLVDHLVTCALDAEGVPEVREPPPQFNRDDDSNPSADEDAA